MSLDQLPPGVNLCQIPMAHPPPGHVPQFDMEAPLKPVMLGVSISLTMLSTAIIAARFYFNIRKLKIADWCALAGLLSSIAYTAVILYGVDFARHGYDTPLCWFTAAHLKSLLAEGILLAPAIFFPKAAILLLYRQLFGIQKQMRMAVYFGLTLGFLTYWSHVPLSIYFLAPHNKETWDTFFFSGRPQRLVPWGIVQGSLSLVLDIFIFVLPLPTLIKLNMSLKKRLGLMAVFLVGFLGVAAGCIALAYRVYITFTDDLMWSEYSLLTCVIVENNVALMTGSTPAMASFVKDHVANSAFFRSLSFSFMRSSKGSAMHYDSGNKVSDGGSVAPGSHSARFLSSNASSDCKHPDSEYEFPHYMSTKVSVGSGITTMESTLHHHPSSQNTKNSSAGIVKTCEVTQKVKHAKDNNDRRHTMK